MAGDGGRVPDVSEQRAETVDELVQAVGGGAFKPPQVVTVRCGACMGTGEIESSDSTDDRWWTCRVCEGTGKRTFADRRRYSDPASVLAALLAESPEATVAAIEALLTNDEAVSEMENVWAKLGSRDGLFGSVGLLDDASKRRLVSAACRSLLSKAPREDG